MNKKGIIWDFGGVVTSSPFENFNKFEATHGLPTGFIRAVNANNSDSNAWALLERGEISHATFDNLFQQESKNLGHAIRGYDVLPLINCRIRDDIVNFIIKVKKIGISQLCLTNNIKKLPPSEINDDDYSVRLKNIMGNFDHVIESSKLGLRKPDARIYKIAIETLNLSPREIVYFDDLGINLKPASKLGIKTIKVINKEQLLAELSLIFPKVFEDKLVD